VIAADVLTARLAGFLDARGLTADELLATVETSYGEPLAIVATGSVLSGFGNDRSDLDLNVVVDADDVRVVPIPAFKDELLVDTKYFTLAQVEEWANELRDGPWPPSGRLTREGYRRRYLLLFHCVRFATGLALLESERFETVAARLREPWLTDRVAGWWQAEVVRSSLAARWLAPVKPLLAAQRQCDAVLAALEREAALGGQLYFKPKWLSEKLRALGDEVGLEALRDALRVPITASEAPEYLARCQADPGADELDAQLWYAPGVTVQPLRDSTLVSRWGLRGLELRGATLPPVEPQAPLWQGPVASEPDPHRLALFVEDLTWLSIVARA
jgi:hypothetical protein